MSDKNISKQQPTAEESVSGGLMILVAVIVICLVVFVLKIGGVF
jgi:hypothetical protein